VLERDPPEHDRARGVLNRALSATVMRSLGGRFAAAADELADELARRARFDAVGLRRSLPDDGVARRDWSFQARPRASVALCSDSVHMFGPDNELRRAAVAQMGPHVEWIALQCKRDALSDDGIGAMIHAGADAGDVTR
jgi:cytochrome P450